jgi:hypothetical protein
MAFYYIITGMVNPVRHDKMATLSTALRKFSKTFDLSTESLHGKVRFLRPAGMIAKGRRGVGGGDPEVNEDHLATLLLSVISAAAGEPDARVVNNVRELADIPLLALDYPGAPGANLTEFPQVARTFGEFISSLLANTHNGTALVQGYRFANCKVEICQRLGLSATVTYASDEKQMWFTFHRTASPTGRNYSTSKGFFFGADVMDEIASILGEKKSSPLNGFKVSIRTAAFGRQVAA